MDVNLIMFKENGQRKDFPMRGKSFTIGRREDCDLRIPLPSVSRKHCKFVRGDTGLELKDLASSNGTFVNNQRVQETILKAGDRVVVGPVVFVVQIDGDPPEPKSVKTRLTKVAPAPSQGVVTPDAVDGDEEGEEVVVEAIEDEQPFQPSAPPPRKQLGMSDDEELDPIAALEALAGAADEDDQTVDVEPPASLEDEDEDK